MELTLKYRALRAAKARFNVGVGKILDFIAVFLAILLFFGGVLLLVLAEPIGWLLVGLIAWPMMFHIWKVHDLSQLAPAKPPRNLSDILDGDILGVLPKDPTPRDIATAAMTTSGGRFFAARFGISTQFLPELASDQAATSTAVWTETLRLHNALPDRPETITSATVVAALVSTSPAARDVLSTLHLDEDDITHGAEWFAHLMALIDYHAAPKLTGGIARDWDFGYIPTLQRFGVNLSLKYSADRSLNSRLETHQDLVASMVDTFGSGGRQNVALIGPLGVGKSTVVDSFAETIMDGEVKIPDSLRFRQVFALDAAALISAASERGQI